MYSWRRLDPRYDPGNKFKQQPCSSWTTNIAKNFAGPYNETSSLWKTVLSFWKYLKEFDIYNMCVNLRESCACSEYENSRTPFPVCVVLARTFLLKILIRPLYKFLGRSKGKTINTFINYFFKKILI